MMPAGRDLSGRWRAAPADDDLRRRYQAADFDDSGWLELDVPGHWQRHPALSNSAGSLLYRRGFEAPPPDQATRSWLVFDGVFYQSDVWLDGSYLGDTEGYFFPHAFEITEQLATRSEHQLATEVSCAPQDDKRRKRNLTGVFQHWDTLDDSANPGGIWRPVRIEHSGPVRILHDRVICTDADAHRATVAFRLVLHTAEERSVTVQTTVASVEHSQLLTLAAGDNHLEWTVAVPDPSLWWPHALGDQPLHDATVRVELDDGSTSDERHRRIGLRSVQMDNWIMAVNGERLFLKGTNQGPTSFWLAEAGADAHRQDLQLARDAGLDLVRVHAHVGRRELYDLADEMGMLLWQDMPLQWGYHRSVRPQAMRQAREAVDLLGHHPSIAMWCGHNEPMAISIDAEGLADPRSRAKIVARAAMDQELPSYNRSILDRSIARTLRRSDGSRPVIPHSGVFPHLPKLDGTDTHLYFGWYLGEERQLPAFCAAVPRLVRFVSEFGSQSVPADADFMDHDAWPNLDWDHLAEHHSLQKVFFDRYVPPRDFATLEGWADATRQYQATLIRHHVETLRRLKYHPTGGFTQFCFADSVPAVTWSVLSVERRPKEAYQALAAACRPVIVVAQRPPEHLHAREPIEWDVHVVSDLRVPLLGVQVTARLVAEHAEQRFGWDGDVGADECVRIGRISTTAPTVGGPLRLVLELHGTDANGDKISAENDYETMVVSGHHEHRRTAR